MNNLRHATNSELLCEAFLHAFTGQPLPDDADLRKERSDEIPEAAKEIMREMGINPETWNTKAEKSGAELTSRFFFIQGRLTMKIRLLILSLLVSVPAFARQPQTGDIIFQISRSSQSKAIQLATHSDYSHTGMLVMRNKSPTF